MALILVLWVLSLLTIMAGSFTLTMRREASIVAGAKDSAHAVAIAESGIAIAEMMLLSPDLNKRWRADGSIYEIDYVDTGEGGISKVRVRVLSEMGKIDLNNADQKLLQELMFHAPVDTDQQNKLVSAILDWRDGDDLVNPDGAELKDYQDAGLKYQPRNKPFQTVEELQLVLGMDEATYKWLEPLVTVYSGQSQVDLKKASKEVLEAVSGLDTGLIDDYVAARLESAINSLPQPAFPLSPGQNAATGQTEALAIVSEALLDDTEPDSSDNESGTRATVNAIIEQSNGAQSTPFLVLKWQRNAVTDASLFTDAMSELLVKQYAEYKFNN
ncbi:MAG: general secretion pathway protein GspK [Methylococcaceae bacterium]